MAYTYLVLENLKPLGSGQLSSGDNSISAIVDALIERLETAFLDINGNPLVPRDTAFQSLGDVQNKEVVYGPLALMPGNSSVVWDEAGTYVEITGADAVKIPIDIPQGCTITRIKYIVDRGIGIVSARTVKILYTTAPAQSNVHGDVAAPGPGIVEIDSGALTEIVQDAHYAARIEGTTTFKVYMVKVTYNTPDFTKVR